MKLLLPTFLFIVMLTLTFNLGHLQVCGSRLMISRLDFPNAYFHSNSILTTHTIKFQKLAQHSFNSVLYREKARLTKVLSVLCVRIYKTTFVRALPKTSDFP